MGGAPETWHSSTGILLQRRRPIRYQLPSLRLRGESVTHRTLQVCDSQRICDTGPAGLESNQSWLFNLNYVLQIYLRQSKNNSDVSSKTTSLAMANF